MNLFILDNDINENAKAHVDSHVVKMIVEIAQLLSTAHRMLDGKAVEGKSKSGRRQIQYIMDDQVLESKLYKSTHPNHPCAIWVRESLENYEYACKLGLALCKEFIFRFGKVHSTTALLKWLSNNAPTKIKSKGMTPFAQAMPVQYRSQNPVSAYRFYYKFDKTHIHKWSRRDTPKWINEKVITK